MNYIGKDIFTEFPFKNGTGFLCGEVVKETEKAILIHFYIQAFLLDKAKQTYNKKAWIPKSTIEQDKRAAKDNIEVYQIKAWFLRNGFKSYYLK